MKQIKGLFVICCLLINISTAFAADPSSQLRVLHAVPDAGPIDVIVDGKAAFSGVSFTEISDYIPLDAGSYTIQIQLTSEPGAYLLETTVEINPNETYTLINAGKLLLIETVLLNDNLPTPQTDEVQVRLVHLSPNAPTIDLLAENDQESALFNETGFKDITTYRSMKAETYDVTLKVSGTSVVALTTPTLQFESGLAYTLFVVGLAGGEPGLQIISQADASILEDELVGKSSVNDTTPSVEAETETATVDTPETATEETTEMETVESTETADSLLEDEVLADSAPLNEEATTVEENEVIVQTPLTEAPLTAQPASLALAQQEALAEIELKTTQHLVPPALAPDTMPVTGLDIIAELPNETTSGNLAEPTINNNPNKAHSADFAVAETPKLTEKESLSQTTAETSGSSMPFILGLLVLMGVITLGFRTIQHPDSANGFHPTPQSSKRKYLK